MKKVYCSGKNTGCDHEDKPNLKECSDCPYMTTIEPRQGVGESVEQDELLLTLEKLDRHWNGKSVSADWQPLFNGATMAQDIFLAVKQHYEQKRLDRPKLREKIADILIDFAREINGSNVNLRPTKDKILALIPDIAELQEWYNKLLAEFKTLKREQLVKIEEAKKQERERIGHYLYKLWKDKAFMNMLRMEETAASISHSDIRKLCKGQALKEEK